MRKHDTTRRARNSSTLPSAVRTALRGVVVLGTFMIANALFLVAVRIADTAGWAWLESVAGRFSRFFQAMILAHTGIGIVAATVTVIFVVGHLTAVWRRRHPASVVSGVALVILASTLLVSGLFILTEAASQAHRWVWWLHVSCAVLALYGYVRHRYVNRTRPARLRLRRFGITIAGLAASLMVVHVASGGESSLIRGSVERSRSLVASGSSQVGRPIRENEGTFVPVGEVDPLSPFFPSPATTTSGRYASQSVATGGESPEGLAEEVRELGFASVSSVGAGACVRCHPDVVEQWSTSAHRFSSFNNPFYEAAVRLLRDSSQTGNEWIGRHLAAYSEVQNDVAAVKSKWCGACHDPALMLSGAMSGLIDRASAAAQAGLTCGACHLIDEIHDRTGNGNYNLADTQRDPYLFAGAARGTVGAFLHDAAVRARPDAHRERMLRPFFRSSEFCAACHKVSLSAQINNYRWLRGQDEFDAWDDSGISHNAARTFYLPPERRVCQDCHMPPEEAPLGDVAAVNGTVRSHRFVAANTALAYVRGDQETLSRVESFLREGKLSVDIFALDGERWGEPVMALDRARPDLVAGERVTVEVVVRNQGVGHTFPGGTNDSNEGWLEFTLKDDRGDILVRSGYLASDGSLDPMAHVYKSILVDAAGEPVMRRNSQDARATVFANVIGPGAADVARYEFLVPPVLAGRIITLEARLLWRKFNRSYTRFAYQYSPEGFRRFDALPDLPVTEIASDELELQVVPHRRASGRITSDSVEWMRYNDYGIGLLLEGDTRHAALAFERVSLSEPGRVDGPLNLARAAISDGDVERAYLHLRECEERVPGDARVAWVWGVTLQEDGRYREAEAAYRRVLEEFPNDRATWRNMGRTLYLDGRYEAALEAFARVLEIDPEDRVAHYHRMLSLRALGRDVEAKAAAAAYQYYAVDETAQALTRQYRLQHPGVNLMTQRIRTHRLTLEFPR